MNQWVLDLSVYVSSTFCCSVFQIKHFLVITFYCDGFSYWDFKNEPLLQVKYYITIPHLRNSHIKTSAIWLPISKQGCCYTLEHNSSCLLAKVVIKGMLDYLNGAIMYFYFFRKNFNSYVKYTYLWVTVWYFYPYRADISIFLNTQYFIVQSSSRCFNDSFIN